MKRINIIILSLLLPLMAMADDIMTRQNDGTYVVNSAKLCKARGFKDVTPVEVYIKGDKIVYIIPLRNKETPQYFKIAADGVTKAFVGKKVSKVLNNANTVVDGVTGATFSAKALQMNVREALKYYKKNK